MDQVRRDHPEQQRALGERLADQADVELFQVAQATVDELAGAGGGAGGEVPGLDQAYREPAGGGVQRHARAHHAAADDQHLMLGAGQRCERRGPRPRAEPDRTGRFGHHMRNASIRKRVSIPLVSAEAAHSG